MAGYSKRSLLSKLGIKETFRLIFIHPPEGYRAKLGPLPERTTVGRRLSGSFNFIQIFVTKRSTFEKEFPRLKKYLSPTGMLWVSWPKGSSKMDTDLNENVVREVGLKNEMVDVKVAAIDEIWSGLKFVFRMEHRYF
jgi:hypothetical protein